LFLLGLNLLGDGLRRRRNSEMTASHATAPLLEIDALSVSIGGAEIIKNLSLRVGAGEILGLVGASGSGKSMTLLPSSIAACASRAQRRGALARRGADRQDETQLQSIRGREHRHRFQEPMTALNP